MLKKQDYNNIAAGQQMSHKVGGLNAQLDSLLSQVKGSDQRLSSINAVNQADIFVGPQQGAQLDQVQLDKALNDGIQQVIVLLSDQVDQCHGNTIEVMQQVDKAIKTIQHIEMMQNQLGIQQVVPQTAKFVEKIEAIDHHLGNVIQKMTKNQISHEQPMMLVKQAHKIMADPVADQTLYTLENETKTVQIVESYRNSKAVQQQMMTMKRPREEQKQQGQLQNRIRKMNQGYMKALFG